MANSRTVLEELYDQLSDVVGAVEKFNIWIGANTKLRACTDAVFATEKAPLGALDIPIATADVRLALRALYPFLKDDALLRAYWAAAAAPRDHAWDSCHRPYEAILKALLQLGLPVEAELR